MILIGIYLRVPLQHTKNKRVPLQHTFRNEKVNRLTFSLFVLFFYIKHMIIEFCIAAT